ncbi:hypothetical protein NHX12_014559 [Muraenolepis orangiensis]|uniref:Uncharacterized protein n=1 Tax=Muraenolepis orangiensis TaxID=630683 RepID=A0A9Q0D8R0_9TELE|nr:hypothetical protein NHX12_014559 [Muraenolepis orangiensis]
MRLTHGGVVAIPREARPFNQEFDYGALSLPDSRQVRAVTQATTRLQVTGARFMPLIDTGPAVVFPRCLLRGGANPAQVTLALPRLPDACLGTQTHPRGLAPGEQPWISPDPLFGLCLSGSPPNDDNDDNIHMMLQPIREGGGGGGVPAVVKHVKVM